MKHTCATCPWMHERKIATLRNAKGEDVTLGAYIARQCRLRAPVLGGVLNGDELVEGWPSVQPEDGCGDHPEAIQERLAADVAARVQVLDANGGSTVVVQIKDDQIPRELRHAFHRNLRQYLGCRVVMLDPGLELKAVIDGLPPSEPRAPDREIAPLTWPSGHRVVSADQLVPQWRSDHPIPKFGDILELYCWPQHGIVRAVLLGFAASGDILGPSLVCRLLDPPADIVRECGPDYCEAAVFGVTDFGWDRLLPGGVTVKGLPRPGAAEESK